MNLIVKGIKVCLIVLIMVLFINVLPIMLFLFMGAR